MKDEELLAPQGHAGLLGGEQRLAAEEEGRVARGRRRGPCALARRRISRQVGVLHEAVVGDDAVEAAGRAAVTSTRSARGTCGHVLGRDREQDHLLVQHLVVLEVVQQRRRARRRGCWS